METTARARRRHAARLRVPNLALIAGLFLQPSQTPLASAAAVSVSLNALQHYPLHRRDAGEHVVLADCLDGAGVFSSQMAYYTGDPNGNFPRDVAVVVTAKGQTALWVNANTSALFTGTATTFTATLGPRVDEGQYAGTGNNGYGTFSCYQRYFKDRYTWEKTTCSQVYDCDHSDPPAESDSASGGGMTQGTIIAIAVGVVGGLLFFAAAGIVYWYFRRSRRQQEGRRRPGELLKSSTESSSPLSQLGDHSSQGRPMVQQMNGVYEMDSRLFRLEMASDNGKFELDAHGHGNAELDSAGKNTPNPDTTAVSPMSPSIPVFPDSPLMIDQAPPPSYAHSSYLQKPPAH